MNNTEHRNMMRERAAADRDFRKSGRRISSSGDTSISGLIDRVSELQIRILNSIDDQDIFEAELQQRMVSFGILTQNRQLLEGKATVIFGSERRERVEALAAALLAEADRRGIKVSGDAIEGWASGVRERDAVLSAPRISHVEIV